MVRSRKINTEAQAITAGKRDGTADVEAVLREQGLAGVVASLQPGQPEWDEGAINAGAAEIVGIPAKFRAKYYRAYAEAGRVRAAQIAAEKK